MTTSNNKRKSPCRDEIVRLRGEGILIKLSKEDIKHISERKAKRAIDIRSRTTYGKEGRRYYECNSRG